MRRRWRLAKVLGLAALIALPFVVPFGTLGTANLAMTYALVALSLVVLTGWVGQISLAQATFVGLGAYTTAVVVRAEIPLLFPLTIAAGALVAAGVAALLGLVALRVRGLYLAVATLIFAWMAQGYIFNLPSVGGIGGSSIARTEPLGEPGQLPFLDFTERRTFYFLMLAVVAGSLLAAANLRDSKTGRAWFAVKGSEVAAASLGIDVTKAKLVAFAVSGFLAGLAGGLVMTHASVASASSFTVERSLFFLAIAVVGGLTSIAGAVASGVLFASLEELFFRVEVLAGLLLFVSAALLAGVLLFFPAGLAGIPPQIRNLVAKVMPSPALGSPASSRFFDPVAWFSWRGRINRFAYLIAVFLAGAIVLLYRSIPEGSAVLRLPGAPLVLGAAYVSVVSAIKRAHDRGRSGLFVLLLYVPVLGLWPLFEFLFMPGTRGENRYGPDPLEGRAEGPVELEEGVSGLDSAPDAGPVSELAPDASPISGPDSAPVSERGPVASKKPPSVWSILLGFRRMAGAGVRRGPVAARGGIGGRRGSASGMGVGRRSAAHEVPDVLASALQAAAAAEEEIIRRSMSTSATLSYKPGSASKVELAPRDELEPVLSASDITVRFGGLVAVDSYNLEVRKGEIVGLIGPNGAGKTTLFNAIAGLNQPTSGTVGLFGEDVTDVPVSMRAAMGVGRTFQVLQLFPELTVFDNLMVATHTRNPTGFFSHLAATRGAILWEASGRSRVRQVIELTGLREVSDRPVSGLPFGTLRLVELARALVTGAPFVMLDEPASGLDNVETDRFMDFLLWVRQSLGVTILLIEHDMRVAMGLADYMYVIDRGKQIATGTPAEIQRNEKVIAAYLGEAPTAEGEEAAVTSPAPPPAADVAAAAEGDGRVPSPKKKAPADKAGTSKGAKPKAGTPKAAKPKSVTPKSKTPAVKSSTEQAPAKSPPASTRGR